MNDTIAAIATAQGIGAISIIRVSGEEAIFIVQKIFSNQKLENAETHTIHYGFIKEEDKKIDEVLVCVMRAPKSFTMEDVVEIHCHGGVASTKKILELLLLNGARLAEPGEFTKRAFLNGRIDLQQAEGVMDLIHASTDNARALAMNQLSGDVSKKIQEIREGFVEVLTSIAVNIDYPEYEENIEITHAMLQPKIKILIEKMMDLLHKSEEGQIVKTGVKTAIIGRPNVGKSSLLNILLNEEKAIVTDIEGTTRDMVEGSILLGGVQLNIIDTAGIRKTDNLVESIGVEKSLNLIDTADFILFVVNNNQAITKEERELFAKIRQKKYLVIVNKIDLDTVMDLSFVEKDKLVKISSKEKIGINQLKEKIREIFESQVVMKDLTYLTNARSIALLKKSFEKTKEVEKALDEKIPVSILELDIREIWQTLGEIIGETYEEEFIDALFSRFCL